MSAGTYHMLVFYVPEGHEEKVKDAVFRAGAGKLGNYDQCCWQIRGQGQFRPLAGSQPYLGDVNVTEFAEEIRVELICRADQIRDAVAALSEAHPYETPAYAHWPVCV